LIELDISKIDEMSKEELLELEKKLQSAVEGQEEQTHGFDGRIEELQRSNTRSSKMFAPSKGSSNKKDNNNNSTVVQTLTDKWVKVCQRVLLQLQDKAMQPISLGQVMVHFHIPQELQTLMKFNPETEEFAT